MVWHQVQAGELTLHLLTSAACRQDGSLCTWDQSHMQPGQQPVRLHMCWVLSANKPASQRALPVMPGAMCVLLPLIHVFERTADWEPQHSASPVPWWSKSTSMAAAVISASAPILRGLPPWTLQTKGLPMQGQGCRGRAQADLDHVDTLLLLKHCLGVSLSLRDGHKGREHDVAGVDDLHREEFSFETFCTQ